MTILEFFNNYNLHDSFIEIFKYNENEKALELDINFAFWMQKWYKTTEPENGIIQVCFREVTEYVCNGDPTGAFVGILNTKICDGELIINLLDDESN